MLCISYAVLAAKVPSTNEEYHAGIASDMGTSPVRQVLAKASSTCFPPINGLPQIGKKYPSHIFYAADDFAWIFVNGVPVNPNGKLTDWHDTGFVMALVKPGDVIVIKAKNGCCWFGAIAALYYQGNYFVTGTDEWRAIEETSSNPLPDGWMTPSYNDCEWPLAQVRPGAGTYNNGKSPYFPFYTMAKYVWAQGANGSNKTIYLRFKVGQSCPL